MYTGLHLSTQKHLTASAAIQTAPAPDRVVLPLNQHTDAALEPCLQVGDYVKLGQVIAKPRTALSAWLHASVSGVIHAIELRMTAHSEQPVNCIVIDNDGNDTLDDTLKAGVDWSQLNAIKLCEHIAQGGIVGLGGAAYATATKLAAHQRQPITTLLINGMECEPYISCDDHLLRERAITVLHGIQILLHACGATRAIIALEDDKLNASHSLRAALQSLADKRIELRNVPTAYPSGDEGQLIKQLLDMEIPHGQLPADIGIIVHNVGTAYACAQWILQGRPLISRIVTVTGHGVRRTANLEVRLGTACAALIAHCGGYQPEVTALIMGGAMMGRALPNDDLPIVKASNCLIAATHADFAPLYAAQPCIRCGECMDACPVGLMPQQLHLYLRNNNATAALELGLRDCIECGCCDFVCPSHIVLAAQFRTAKQQHSPPTALSTALLHSQP